MRTITVTDDELEHIRNAMLAQRYAWRGLRRESNVVEQRRIDKKINFSLSLEEKFSVIAGANINLRRMKATGGRV